MNRKHCAGCRHNIYNVGVYECSMLRVARLIVRRKMSIKKPNNNVKPQEYPACYEQAGYEFINV